MADDPAKDASQPAGGRHSSASLLSFMAVYAIAILAVAAPIVIFPIPPLVDYPAHLARQLIIHDLLSGGAFASMYQLHIAVIPNLGIEAVVLPLLFLGMPVEIAGRLFLLLILVLLGSGVVRVHRALFGHVSFFPLLAFAFVFNPIFMWGFTNFLLGTALALHAFAWWLRARQRPAAAILPVLLLWTLALFFSHLMAVGFFFGLVGSYEAALALVRRRGADEPSGNFLRTLALLAVPAAVAAILYHLAPLSSGPHAIDTHSLRDALAQIRPRLRALPSYLSAYSRPIDIAIQLALVGILVLSASLRRLRVSWPMLVPICGLLTIYLLGPEKWGGTDLISYRLPVVAMFLFFCSLDVEWDARFFPAIAAIAIIGLRTGEVLNAWAQANAQYRPMLQALAALPARSSIYTAVNYRQSFEPLVRMPWLHIDAYGTLRNRLFVKSVWADPTQNWIVHTPKYAQMAKPQLLSNRVDRNEVPRKDADMFDATFMANYDFLLAVQPELYQKPIPAGVRAVVRSGQATLFSLHDR